jgi:arachidonate 15-lipoxygenase
MSSASDRRSFLRTSLAGTFGFGWAGGASRPADAAEPVCGNALLPQDDPDPRARQRHLLRARGRYGYDFDRVPTLPMADRIPLADQFSIAWALLLADRALDLARNFAPGPGRAKVGRTLAWRRALEALAAHDPGPLLDLAEQAAADDVGGPDRPQSLEDYAALFRTIERPGIVETFRDDRVFARQRVAGANPLVIRRIAGLDDRFPVTEALFRSVLAGDSLAAAGQEGRLYLADYRELHGVQAGSFRGVPKFLSAPLALFALEKGSRQLVPVAIQCEQQPGPDNPIFTPHDGHAWLMAKTLVQVADANVHETVSHLGRTHLWVEPFPLATERQLAANHPLRLLLRPHFEGTIAINRQAHARLLAPAGFVDDLLGGTLEASIQLTTEAVRSYRFEEAMLPRALQARGVDDPAVLPDYPYRDDALLCWNAIRAWVADYLRVYYHSDAAVAADFELAGWYRELCASDGGRITGWGRDGHLGGFEDLVDAATLIIFTCSVQHAAVNFPQFDLMTYMPNMPLAAFTPTPVPPTAGEQDLLDLLPPLTYARRQITILYVLGTTHYTALGRYRPQELCDPRIRPALEAFRDDLATVGHTIEERNRLRAPYPFLDPTGIPQSINI